MDSVKTSDRDVTFVLAATAQSLGRSVDDFNMNKFSIRRDREKKEKKLPAKKARSFNRKYLQHYNEGGKLLAEITGKEIVDG